MIDARGLCTGTCPSLGGACVPQRRRVHARVRLARGITHSIRAGIGPFRNVTAGGTHVHHSTFGIFGVLTCGSIWTYQCAVGTNPDKRWLSRFSAVTYGIASALTLDEFALWLDLKDD